MGQAILHIHTTFSDGLATVEEILDTVEADGRIDVVGFTDHDDVRSYAAAERWKARHPDSKVQPLWGLELTLWRFQHLLVYQFEPPFPERAYRKFLPLGQAVQQIKAAGGLIIVPHVDIFWVGLGRRRLARLAHPLGIDGFELLNPFHGSPRCVGNLDQMNRDLGLLAVGGSDAHHLEDLYRVIVEFPGQSVADLGRAFRQHTAVPRWGWNGPPVPLRRKLRQQRRALVEHPTEQVRSWMTDRLASLAGPRP